MKTLVSNCTLFFLSLCFGCSLPFSGTHSTLYAKKEKNKKIRISSSFYAEHTSYTMLVYEKKELKYQFFVRFPDNKKVMIDRLIPSKQNSNGCFRVISDTANMQLASLDFKFLQNENKPSTLAAFTIITSEEKELLHLFANVLSANHTKESISSTDIDRLIGWVRIYY